MEREIIEKFLTIKVKLKTKYGSFYTGEVEAMFEQHFTFMDKYNELKVIKYTDVESVWRFVE